jgi:hypothetical protein
MRENAIDDQDNACLRSKPQNLVAPASMGLGLLLGGCNSPALGFDPDGRGDSPSSGSPALPPATSDLAASIACRGFP